MNNKRPSIYVVDDDPSVREATGSLIRAAGLRVETFASAQEFLASPRADVPSCLVLDVQLPGLSGLDLQQELAKADVQIPIIFVTGHGDIPTSVRAIKAGALEFLTKPFNDQDLLDAIEQGIQRDLRAREPRSDIARSHSSFDQIIGTSAALSTVLDQVEIVAPTRSTVLIYGETGTGKELIARAIHDLSPRRANAFVKLNCAAIPTGLLESELFGHEKGAFTGAVAQRIGRFELANRGTVFLDEIGEIPLELQPKLLRVLQEQEFERLGSGRTVRTDTRLVAATNGDLSAMVAEGKFRADLFYRLNVFPVQLPPLRERREDLPLLVKHFVDQFTRRLGRDIDKIPPETMERLVAYHWPGNIRELQNIIERSVVLSMGPVLKVPLSDLKPNDSAFSQNTSDTMEQAERKHILAVLQQTNWVVGGPNGAAARLAMNRTTLQFRMSKLGITRPARYSRL
jgi:DNA-binding NtrC family response regulator